MILQQLTRSDERYERIEKLMSPIVQAATAIELLSGKLEPLTQSLVAAALLLDKLALPSFDSDGSESNPQFTPIVSQATSAPSPKSKKRKTDPLSNSQLSNSNSQSLEVYQDAHPSTGLDSTLMLASNSAFQKPTPERQLSSSSPRHPSVSHLPVLAPVLLSSQLKPHNSSRNHQQLPHNAPVNQQKQHNTQERKTTTMPRGSSCQLGAKPKHQSGGSLPSSTISTPRRLDSKHVIITRPECPSSLSALPQIAGGRIPGSSDAHARQWATTAGTEKSDSRPAATATDALATTSRAIAVAPARDLIVPFDYNRTQNVVEATQAKPGSVSIAFLSLFPLYITALSAKEKP